MHMHSPCTSATLQLQHRTHHWQLWCKYSALEAVQPSTYQKVGCLIPSLFGLRVKARYWTRSCPWCFINHSDCVWGQSSPNNVWMWFALEIHLKRSGRQDKRWPLNIHTCIMYNHTCSFMFFNLVQFDSLTASFNESLHPHNKIVFLSMFQTNTEHLIYYL